MTICGRCGRDNPDDGRFCSSCGTPLPSETEARTDAASADSDDHPTATIATSDPGPEQAPAAEATRSLETGEDDDDDGHEMVEPGVDALLPGTALLVVQRGPSAGSRFLLDADVVAAGRHPDSDIFLDDVTVSRRHAEFVRSDEIFRVRDVGSLNGTYVNRTRIDDIVLESGNEVQIGKFRLVYFAGPAEGGAE